MPEIIDNYIPRYDVRQQIEAVRFQEPLPTFFRKEFFKGAPVYSPTETIEWDEVREGAGMARYVAEHLEVPATEREGFITREIVTPKVQEKRVLTIMELKKRLPGENTYSMKSPADRAREFLLGDYNFCMTAIDRRVEQQCAQMMTMGKIDIIGLGVNAYVDYNLPFKLTLSGTDRWGSGGKPLETLADMAKKLRTRGYTPDSLLMELSASKALLDDPEIQKYLDNRRFELGLIKPGALNDQFLVLAAAFAVASASAFSLASASAFAAASAAISALDCLPTASMAPILSKRSMDFSSKPLTSASLANKLPLCLIAFLAI